MPKVKYSREAEPEHTSKAMGRELPLSPKHGVELCRELKGKRIKEAKKYLEEVIDLRRAVPFKHSRRDVPHRRGTMMAGRYPKKAARGILRTLENAENNAEYKGLNVDKLVIEHIATHRGEKIEGRLPRAFGRATAFDRHTSNIEIILSEEKEEK